jgi:hypothetical protein
MAFLLGMISQARSPAMAECAMPPSSADVARVKIRESPRTASPQQPACDHELLDLLGAVLRVRDLPGVKRFYVNVSGLRSSAASRSTIWTCV